MRIKLYVLFQRLLQLAVLLVIRLEEVEGEQAAHGPCQGAAEAVEGQACSRCFRERVNGGG
jgi:hypothetical protein